MTIAGEQAARAHRVSLTKVRQDRPGVSRSGYFLFGENV